MEPSLKRARRPWAPREIVMVLAIVALAVALFLERAARRDGDRDTAADTGLATSRLLKMITERSASDADWKLEHGKQLDHLESRVLDLEHDKKAGK